jgi:uncharacterized protein
MVKNTYPFMRWIQVASILVTVLLGFYLWNTKGDQIFSKKNFLPTTPVMHIGEIPVRVEIADTEEELRQGLSGRTEIEGADGLLFIFSEADYHGIWMKDMNFPIDIIWIGEDLEVINIMKNVDPDTYPKTFRPEKPAKYALETEVRFAETMGIHKGQSVRLPLEYREVSRD